MKKTLSFLSTIMVVLSFVSCSSFSSKKVEGNESCSSVSSNAVEENERCLSFSFKTVEGNWWHSWGADGYDYVCIQSNKKCDYDFGDARNNKGSIVIDNRNKTITILNNHKEVKTFIYEEKNDMLVEPSTNYELWRMPQELNEEISEVISKSNDNKWLYGTWKCRTPYGTIKVILQEDGSMYDSTEDRWHKYTIEGDRIIEHCKGYISTYNIDRANERFDCGEPGMWFYKE